MGRGGGESGTDPLSLLYGRGVKMGTAPRPKRGKDSFSLSLEEWKKQEKAFVDGVMEDLSENLKRVAGSKESWKSFLDLYAQAPDYSAMNNLWARSQLRAKETTEPGLLLSESAWEKLGRRVKADYARPLKKRDKKFGYDNDRDWDDRYSAEMMRPLGRSGWWKTLKDKGGKPLLDAEGQPRKEWVPGAPDKGYATFVVYHEEATEALEGGDPNPLPGREKAKGPEDGARNLLADIRDRVLPGQGITLEEDAGQSEVCRRSGQTLYLNPSAPITDQASAVLLQAVEGASSPRQDESEEQRELRQAACESSRYVIASLYGLDTGDQAFPHLDVIAEDGDRVRSLQSEVHRRTKALLGHLDPRMRETARAAGKAELSRRKKRQEQKKTAA
jgi:hypothetical protein